MTAFAFFFCLLCISYCAGILGALTGLGGGAIITPALVLLFHIDIHYALGASLIAVMATSSGATVQYLQSAQVNIRIGIFLSLATVLGALLGATLLGYTPKNLLATLLGIVLLCSAYFTAKRQEQIETPFSTHPWAKHLQFSTAYSVQNVPLAFLIMSVAGCLSGLLGIGAGVLKVLAMDQVMRLPYKASTTTSNFMIGITAATSAGIYLERGYIDPILCFPVLIGVVLGAYTGAHLLPKLAVTRLRLLFSIIVSSLALQMVVKGLWRNF